MLRWGLVPFWAKEAKIGYKMINARAETVADKPAFRAALRLRRCLIPASGFFEWKPEKGGKQPYCIRPKEEGDLFAFAGLWERWQGGEGEPLESCTIIVTEANRLLRPIHDRMPVILRSEDYSVWLDPEQHHPEILEPLLRPYLAEQMILYPVSQRVNSPANDDAGCIEPMRT